MTTVEFEFILRAAALFILGFTITQLNIHHISPSITICLVPQCNKFTACLPLIESTDKMSHKLIFVLYILVVVNYLWER